MNLKPRILDWYIIRNFMTTFFMMLLLIVVIVIIFDISEKIDYLVANEAPVKAVIFDYYMNFIPYFMNMYSPIFIFITVIFFTSRMAARTEIIGILSCGVSFHRLMLPYVLSAGFITVLSLYLNLFVIPHANIERLKFENTYVKKKASFDTNNVHYQISPGTFAYVSSFSDWNNTAYDFTIETIKNNRLVSKLSARRAVWDSTMQGWKLSDYFIRTYSDDKLADKVVKGEKLDTVINLKIEDFYRKKNTVQQLSFSELNDLISTQKMRGDENVKYSLIEHHQRLALPFSAFILTIMGVALSSRKKRGGIGWNMVVGIGLSFSYILFMRFSQMFVYTDSLPPLIAIWLPNMIYSVVALVLYRIAPK